MAEARDEAVAAAKAVAAQGWAGLGCSDRAEVAVAVEAWVKAVATACPGCSYGGQRPATAEKCSVRPRDLSTVCTASPLPFQFHRPLI